MKLEMLKLNYYPEHGSMGMGGIRADYPDEVIVPGLPPIKRVKTISEMTEEDHAKYGAYIYLAAKDIRVSRGVKLVP